jgi:hypothetical protein
MSCALQFSGPPRFFVASVRPLQSKPSRLTAETPLLNRPPFNLSILLKERPAQTEQKQERELNGKQLAHGPRGGRVDWHLGRYAESPLQPSLPAYRTPLPLDRAYPARQPRASECQNRPTRDDQDPARCGGAICARAPTFACGTTSSSVAPGPETLCTALFLGAGKGIQCKAIG